MAVLSKAKKTNKKTLSAKVFDAPREKFQYYWERIEKAEKAYLAAERQRSRLMEEFNAKILPLEQDLCKVHEAYIYRLLSYSNKKTLPLYLKEALFDWVQDEFDHLMSSPFRGHVDTEALQKKIVESLNAVGEKSAVYQQEKLRDREHMRMEIEMLGLDPDSFTDDDLDALIIAMMRGPHVFLDELMRLAADIHKDSAEQAGGEQDADADGSQAHDHVDSDDQQSDFFKDFFEEAFGFSPEDEMFDERPSTTQQDVLSKKSLNKFYKKIAQRIHPDRARDAKDRDRRNELMQVLTAAKNENDAFTIFSLYQEHVDSAEFNFSDEEFDVLINLLQDKLRVLQRQKRDLKRDGDLSALVYERFQARSKRETNQRIDAHQAHLEEWIEKMENNTQGIKTLKQVKEKLSQRIQEQKENNIFGFIGDFPFSP